jgi:ABC-type transporter Mla subunit MlaD
MRRQKTLALIVSVLLMVGFAPAVADSATDRAATVSILQQKYVTVLDGQHATLLALKEKMKASPTLLKQVNSVLADFDSNYSAIVNGLANPDQALQPIIDLCEEEVEEFANSIYQLQVMLKKATKTITCVKGKQTQKVVGLAPKCPAGFKQK